MDKLQRINNGQIEGDIPIYFYMIMQRETRARKRCYHDGTAMPLMIHKFSSKISRYVDEQREHVD